MSNEATLKTSLPEYEQPPLVEVVFGVQFEPISGYKAPYLMNLWTSLGGKDTFPDVRAMELIPPLSDVNDFFVVKGDELPRHWFLHKDETTIVQFQEDRFIYNWRKANRHSKYPRYTHTLKEFYRYHDAFVSSLTESDFSKPEIKMLEITYINIIPLSDIDDDYSNLDAVLRDFEWTEKNFLPSPKGVNFLTWFDLPDLKARMKIHTTSARDSEDGASVIKIELSIKGRAPSIDLAECKSWFDESRSYIVHSFDEITSKCMHKKWGKK